MEALFDVWTGYMVSLVELMASLVVLIGVVEASARVVAYLIRRVSGARGLERIRIHLGKWLTLALEFALASDIMMTAIAPTWGDIGRLAAIIVLRTVLNYFLDREIRREEERERRAT